MAVDQAHVQLPSRAGVWRYSIRLPPEPAVCNAIPHRGHDCRHARAHHSNHRGALDQTLTGTRPLEPLWASMGNHGPEGRSRLELDGCKDPPELPIYPAHLACLLRELFVVVLR